MALKEDPMTNDLNSAVEDSHSKTRVQFDFAPEALRRLDEIKAKTGAATRAETVRMALRLYEWFVYETSSHPNCTLTLTDQDHIISQFRASLLLK